METSLIASNLSEVFALHSARIAFWCRYGIANEISGPCDFYHLMKYRLKPLSPLVILHVNNITYNMKILVIKMIQSYKFVHV